jgi:hypothetical protein
METEHPLLPFLQTAVPLLIAGYKQADGPTPTDFDRIRAFGLVLAQKADHLLYASSATKSGEAADLANRTADAIAVLSFLPGGITVFDEHWESKP